MEIKEGHLYRLKSSGCIAFSIKVYGKMHLAFFNAASGISYGGYPEVLSNLPSNLEDLGRINWNKIDEAFVKVYNNGT